MMRIFIYYYLRVVVSGQPSSSEPSLQLEIPSHRHSTGTHVPSLHFISVDWSHSGSSISSPANRVCFVRVWVYIRNHRMDKIMQQKKMSKKKRKFEHDGGKQNLIVNTIKARSSTLHADQECEKRTDRFFQIIIYFQIIIHLILRRFFLLKSSRRNRSFPRHSNNFNLPWNTLNENSSGRTWTLPNECKCSCCSMTFRTSISSVNVEPMSRVTCDVKLSDVGLNSKEKSLSFHKYLLVESFQFGMSRYILRFQGRLTLFFCNTIF